MVNDNNSNNGNRRIVWRNRLAFIDKTVPNTHIHTHTHAVRFLYGA